MTIEEKVFYWFFVASFMLIGVAILIKLHRGVLWDWQTVALGFLGMMIATSAASKIRCGELGEVMLDSD